MKKSLRTSFVAALLTIAFLSQGTWALAGTTGGLSGVVMDGTGAPIAGATITVSSPSQSATSHSDAKGSFNFLALAPDSYVVSVTKDQYQPISIAGNAVFADNNSQLTLRLTKALKEIGSVASRANALVKSGVTSDVYSVDSTAIAKSAVLGGGGNLDNAYSAIASVPGVSVAAGGMGWNQAVYIRGSRNFFTGYEYDGIPVNRAFDNYTASTQSNLGLQQLQVYTGSGPSSSSSSGTAGFINQVIKTGQYPGYGSVSLGIGTPQFYHQSRVEAGGASPDRNFSYYVGLSGYNQEYRAFDQSNGASLLLPGGLYGAQGAFTTNTSQNGNLGSGYNNTNGRGVAPLCDANGAPPANQLPWIAAESNGACLIDDPAAGLFNNIDGINDRESILNLHFKLNRKNGAKDDIQLLGSASSLRSLYESSINDGGGLGPYTLAVTGAPYCSANLTTVSGAPCAATNYPMYVDAQVYNLPFGTPIAGHTPVAYFQPSSNPNRAAKAQIPSNLRDPIYNDTGVLKVQYTHPFSDKAYFRAYGYTFYSDWTQAGAESSFNQYLYGGGGPVDTSVAANYDLLTHTSGGELQFADQLNDKHLLTLTGNYTQASVTRFNNTGFTLSPSSPIGYIAQSGNTFTCFDPASGNQTPCIPKQRGFPKPPYLSNSAAGPTGTAPANSAAGQAGAQWVTLWDGAAAGTLNHVKPEFSFVSLTDQFRANDKLLFDLGLRFENYKYVLENSNTAKTAFYASAINQFVCQNAGGTLLTQPLAPGQAPPAPVIYQANCPQGFSHPNFTTKSPSSYTLSDITPRISMTYTQSPDTVYRASVSRNTEPPISASVQYLNSSGNSLSVWNAGLPLGFNAPFHAIPSMNATQADISLEHRIRGTDMSYKVSPFFNYTNGYQEQSFIGPNFVTTAPVGAFRSKGLEFAFNKGDFRRNGLSGSLAVTLTDAKVQYQSRYFGINQVHTANTNIAAFNALTKSGGGSPCYTASTSSALGQPVGTCGPNDIANPYYNTAPQALLDENGWYPGGLNGIDPTNSQTTQYFDSPFVSALILNYRHDKFAITPSFQLTKGSSYGGPYDVAGVDPRTCQNNISNTTGGNIAAIDAGANPNQCDYMSLSASQAAGVGPQLYIPNPETGSFAKLGQYHEPWLFLANVAMSYDVSSKVTANLTLASLFHSCFGGSNTPWSAAFAPGKNVCTYQPNTGAYISNFYNGTSALDTKANGNTPYPFQLHSYTPSAVGAATNQPLPFNAYFSLEFKI